MSWRGFYNEKILSVMGNMYGVCLVAPSFLLQVPVPEGFQLQSLGH